MFRFNASYRVVNINGMCASLASAVLALTLSVTALSVPMSVYAADSESRPTIPEGVRNWILNQDKQADIREDGWVKLTTGEEFLVVQPAEIPTLSDTVKVVNVTRTDEQPDVIVFDNGYFLLRVVPLEGGEKTLPLLENASALLKSAHLPETFHVPDNLYIPNDWKPLLLPDVRFDPSGMPMTAEAASTPEANAEFLWVDGTTLHVVPKGAPSASTTSTAKTAPSSGTPGTALTLPCAPLAKHGLEPVHASGSSPEYLLTCADAPSAYLLQVNLLQPAVTTVDTIALPEVATDVTFNAPSGLAYFAHGALSKTETITESATAYRGWFHLSKQGDEKRRSRKYSLVSVYSLSKHQFESAIQTSEPIQKLYFSAFRQQLYMLSKSGKSLYVARVSAPGSVHQRLVLEAPVRDWVVQYDKLLWLLGTDNVLHAFDMRWQELSQIGAVPSDKATLAADARWVYALLPEKREIARYSILNAATDELDAASGKATTAATSAVSPIALNAQCEPSTMWLDATSDRLYVAEEACKQLSVVNLGSARVLPPVALDVVSKAPAGQFVSAKPMPDDASQLARIRFQDARNLIRNGMVRPQVTLPTEPRAQKASPAQAE